MKFRHHYWKRIDRVIKVLKLKVSNRYDEHTADYSKDYLKLKSLLKKKQLNAIQD